MAQRLNAVPVCKSPPLAVWVFQQVGKGAGLWSERFLQGWEEEAEGLHNETGCCHLETADLVR